MNPPPRLVDLERYLSHPSEAQRELDRLFDSDDPLVIFDVGACEGEESIRYSRLYPRARIFSFEPLPANQELVRTNFARYGVHSARLVPLALSDREGSALFHVSSGRPPDSSPDADWNFGNKSSSLLPPAATAPMFGWIEFKDSVTVTCKTLDGFCREERIAGIDFIHLDVQGAESLVLEGAVGMLPQVGAIWLEVASKELYRGQKLRSDTIAFMRAHGFTLTFETDRGDEGDQFYVNHRTYRGRRRLVLLAAERAYRRIRRSAGRLKRRLLGA